MRYELLVHKVTPTYQSIIFFSSIENINTNVFTGTAYNNYGKYHEEAKCFISNIHKSKEILEYDKQAKKINSIYIHKEDNKKIENTDDGSNEFFNYLINDKDNDVIKDVDIYILDIGNFLKIWYDSIIEKLKEIYPNYIIVSVENSKVIVHNDGMIIYDNIFIDKGKKCDMKNHIFNSQYYYVYFFSQQYIIGIDMKSIQINRKVIYYITLKDYNIIADLYQAIGRNRYFKKNCDNEFKNYNNEIVKPILIFNV